MNLQKFKDMDDIVDNCPKNETIGNSLLKAWTVINNPRYYKAICSVSGGADSDVMLDMCWRVDIDNKIDYVWFDTGLEYQATKDHLEYLEEKYDIKIVRQKAIKPIPLTCKQYGQPFLNKNISEMIHRLQIHDFKWEDKPYEDLIKEYPNCKNALMWWCNKKKSSQFNISGKKYLKAFMIENPPWFNITKVCCDYAKKKVAHKLLKDGEYNLNIIGVRKAEGGVRATAYKSCFDNNGIEYDNFRPLFWYKNEDKTDYEQFYDVIHSKCYTAYGLKRTGCVGCPFGRSYETELEIVETFEPHLFTAVNHIFADSYVYAKQYYEFREQMETKNNFIKQGTV